MKESIVLLGSSRIRICQWGEENQTVLVCLHGLGSTCLSFFELAETLKKDFHIVAIDLPGHGKSSAFVSSSLSQLIDLLHEAMLLLGIHTYHLVAHSWGAWIAIHYATYHPTEVTSLFLMDGGYHDKQLRDAYMAEHLDIKQRHHQFGSKTEEMTYYQKDFSEYRCASMDEHLDQEKSNYPRWSNLMVVAAMDLVKQQNEVFVWHANGETACYAIEMMYQYPITSIKASLPIPMMLLLAKQKEALQASYDLLIDQFLRQFPNTILVSTNASHMVHWDNPTLVMEQIYQFIGK